MIQLRLLFLDPKKRKTQHKENEAIQFAYNMEKDNPEDVVMEMVCNLNDSFYEISMRGFKVILISNFTYRYLDRCLLQHILIGLR